jgi:hypothetical protein
MSEVKQDDSFQAKPLSEADIEAQKKRLAEADPKELNEIFNTCSQVINSILVMVLKQTKDEEDIVEVERLKRVINLAPLDERFLRSKDKIWAAREHILNKNADWFLKRDYKGLIKKDHNQVLIETIVSLVKERYDSMSTEDREKYWQKAIMLLRNVGRYKKLIGES